MPLAPASTGRPPSTRRKLALVLATIAVMYVVTELLLFTAISIKFGRLFNFTAFEAQRREVNAGDDPFGMADVPARLRIRKEIVHPYLGYVYDPGVERSASPYGISDVSPVQHRSADKVIVGIFGGSFADDIAYGMTEELADRLRPGFPGREFVFVKLTIGGYKQPQQLMALNYFLALGGEFDVIINIDGFNDVALPGLENLPHTNPFFPRQWHLRMRTVPDLEFLTTVGKIKFWDSLSEKWTGVFRSGPLRYSVTANTIWRIGDQLLYNQAVANRALLPQMSAVNGYAASGPPATHADDAGMFRALGRVWAESSFQMHAVAQAHGIRYFHFLQPNQYVDGSKPMDAEERRVAIRQDHPYAANVKKGYPVLRQLGRDLVRRGVNFVDLTTVYSDTRSVLYRDNCCHVNDAGQRLVVDAIARAIGSRTERKTSS